MNDQYAVQNAAEKVHGYFLPRPQEAGRHDAAFERAKQECLLHLRDQIQHISSLGYEPFLSALKSSRALPTNRASGVASAIHYPEHWDTAAYPTLESALNELCAWFKCSECAPVADVAGGAT